MKNKFIVFIVIIAILASYPIWRYTNNAKIFASALMNHVEGLGKWSYSSISSGFNGKITIRNLSFTPDGYYQGFEIDSVRISTDPFFLLKSNTQELAYMLPETLSVSINTVAINSEGNDISEMLRVESMWMLMAGYAGSFGCSRGLFESFDESSWGKIFDDEQVYNVDLFYSRQNNGTIDVDLVLDAENQFSSTWSSNLKSSYTDKQIIIDELIADKLYFSYLDNGFNLARNNACKENYNSSFSAYRLGSAEHVQKYFRTYFGKQLPNVLISLYQRLLIPDAEFNAIISLDKRQYLSDIYRSKQSDLFESSTVEISTSLNEYLPIILSEIDYKNIDSNILEKENNARAKWLKEKENRVVKTRTAKDILKPTIFTTGKKKSRMLSLVNIRSAINKKVRMKTIRGRPITGNLRSVKDNIVTVETRYKTGVATLTVALDKIASVELMK